VKVLANHPLEVPQTPGLRLGAIHPPGGGTQGVAQPGPGRTGKPVLRPADAPGADHVALSRRVEVLPAGSGVRFAGLEPASAVHIYSVAGRLVREIRCDAQGAAVWDRRSRTGTRVAPGVLHGSGRGWIEPGTTRSDRPRPLTPESGGMNSTLRLDPRRHVATRPRHATRPTGAAGVWPDASRNP
jgi:hypothetical protein